MFNKPNLFGRPDPLPRRDAMSSSGMPGKGPAAGSDIQSARAGGPSKPAAGMPPSTPRPPAAPIQPPNAAPNETAASTEMVSALEAPSNGSIMGARLIVGPDVKLKGAEILDCDTLVVEGRVEAIMDSRVIRIAENGSFSGKVSIDVAEIHGVFDGELTARSQLIIHSTGRVNGKIRYGKLVADEGCELCGDVSVLSDRIAEKKNLFLESTATVAVAGMG